MLQFELKFKLRAADFFNCYPVLMCRLGTNGLTKDNNFLCVKNWDVHYTYSMYDKNWRSAVSDSAKSLNIVNIIANLQKLGKSFCFW